MRPGDQQPGYRDDVVTKGREAAQVMADFDRSMKSIENAVNASPRDMARFEARIMELAKQEEQRRTAFGRLDQALRRDPTVRWLATGGNAFYPLAAVCILSSLGAALRGATSPMHIYAEVSLIVLGILFLVFAAFGEQR